MDLINQLSKVGIANLISILGTKTYELFKIRGLKDYSAQSLSKLIVNLHGENETLRDKAIRDNLINTLKNNELSEFINNLSLKNSNDSWEEIKKLKFKENSKELKTLEQKFNIKERQVFTENLVEENPEIIEPERGLFSHQIEMLEEVNQILKGPIKKVILHMPTGSGKTRTAINLIVDFIKKRSTKKTNIIWLAHTDELCQQAYEEFKLSWQKLGNRNFNINKIFKRQKVELSEIDEGLTIMSLDSAYEKTKRDQSNFFKLCRKINFIVMDEAHMSVAPTYKHVLELLYSKEAYLIGLTATPGRSYLKPGEDIKLRNFWNKQKVSLKVKGYKNPLDYLVKTGYLAEVKSEPLNSNIDLKKIFTQNEINKELDRINNGQDLSKNFIKKISNDISRINLVIEKIIEENQNIKNKIIVFASSVENAETIKKVLSLENINSALITSKTHPIERAYKINEFKTNNSSLNILINYGVLTTGFDAPKANLAIIARPTQSVSLYSQMVGRVMRGKEAGGKKTCKVITVKDPIYGFKDMSESFNFWEDVWQ
jgi:superfamily II DNA or RNA helicase